MNRARAPPCPDGASHWAASRGACLSWQRPPYFLRKIDMATKSIRAVMLPDGGSVLITLIAQAVPYTDGVGILNERNRMIGWVAISDSDDASREVKFQKVLEIFSMLINTPRNATQPDWTFLQAEAS